MNRYVVLQELENPEFLGALAGPFLDYVDQRAGLLTGEGGWGGRESRKPIGSRIAPFQEYLAGCHMLEGRRFYQTYQTRAAEGDYWAVAAQLGMEELWFKRKNEAALLDLAYELCPESKPTEGGTMAKPVSGPEPWRCWWENNCSKPMPSMYEGKPRFLETLKGQLIQLMRESPLAFVRTGGSWTACGQIGRSSISRRTHGGFLLNCGYGFVKIPAGPFSHGGNGRKSRSIEIPYTYYISLGIRSRRFNSRRLWTMAGIKRNSLWTEAKDRGCMAGEDRYMEEYDDPATSTVLRSSEILLTFPIIPLWESPGMKLWPIVGG